MKKHWLVKFLFAVLVISLISALGSTIYNGYELFFGNLLEEFLNPKSEFYAPQIRLVLLFDFVTGIIKTFYIYFIIHLFVKKEKKTAKHIISFIYLRFVFSFLSLLLTVLLVDFLQEVSSDFLQLATEFVIVIIFYKYLILESAPVKEYLQLGPSKYQIAMERDKKNMRKKTIKERFIHICSIGLTTLVTEILIVFLVGRFIYKDTLSADLKFVLALVTLFVISSISLRITLYRYKRKDMTPTHSELIWDNFLILAFVLSFLVLINFIK